MCYRTASTEEYTQNAEHSFHTQRTRDAAFTFTLQADPHLRWAIGGGPENFNTEVYQRTLENALKDNPDFHIDLGDTFFGRQGKSFQEILIYHFEERPYFGMLCHSSPLFLVLGNHEDEVGWRLNGTENNNAVWATKARQQVYPNPVPNSFYTGNTNQEPFVGLREDYYAWEWGNALFVALDPFWYTKTCPHSDLGSPVGGGSGNGWDWTLGETQYLWLKKTLEQSTAKFKFVFLHNLTAGAGAQKFKLYGRGGVEGARLWEWGGYNDDNTWGFDSKRPGWAKPIHQILVDNKVSIVCHGHDHVFVKQELDGIVYQEVPTAADGAYGVGFSAAGGYASGKIINNSGHLRVTVSASRVTVDYVRAFRKQDESAVNVNGAVAYTYSLESTPIASARNNRTNNYKLEKVFPDTIKFHIPEKGRIRVTVVDIHGREISVLQNGLYEPGDYAVRWNGTDRFGKRVAPGQYVCRLESDAIVKTTMILNR